MRDNGHWRKETFPKAETDVLITFISHRNRKPYVCIGQYFPKGYEIDYCPISEDRKCDFVKEIDDDVWIFTKEMWLESCFHYTDTNGVWIEDDEVIGWKPLPKACCPNWIGKLIDMGEIE